MLYESSISHTTTFAASSAQSAHEYYHLGRIRTRTADTVLSAFAAAVSSVMIAKGVKRDELFEKYDVKLWSYNDNLALFALSTIPYAAAMAVLYVAYRGVSGLRVGLSI